ncbi:hypothetical protein GcM3_035018 [Golovinomyces cichoracearum]|uniref:Nucleoporin Nup159/Nup146 N-terminal domain-containing protein n=1 Tax=Golovinomyces cichoracearum TaxID=62708 RepID=A0A420J3U1_9PEZI|nr:hypothetical protein GcM3_035018 [Golovinomyces cichoracearum]
MFILVHTPSSSFDVGRPPPASFHLATRTPDCQNYTFQKIPDPTQPFGLNRSPQHHFMLRLRDFPPSLQDMIIVASTASTDIGLLTRSKVPLAKNKPAELITDVFTMTEMSDDSRRAQLPFSAQSGDTSPIGVSLDLSSCDKVYKPIPGGEISESSGPVPILMVLNNEGILASWCIIYSESIRQKSVYPGLTAASSTAPSLSNSFGGGDTNSTFGSATTPTPVFGSASQLTSGSTFGTTSNLGTGAPRWGTVSTQESFGIDAPVFGQSTFGSNTKTPLVSSAFGAATFGKPSVPSFGARASVWANQSNNAPNTAFGSTIDAEKKEHIFGTSNQSIGRENSVSSGFASFASSNAFLSSNNQSSSMKSIFKTQSSNPFNSHSGELEQSKKSAVLDSFGSVSPGNFVLGTTFNSEPNTKTEEAQKEQSQTNHFFGNEIIASLDSSQDLDAAKSCQEKTSDDLREKEDKQKITSMNLKPGPNPTSTKSNQFLSSSDSSLVTERPYTSHEISSVKSSSVDEKIDQIPESEGSESLDTTKYVPEPPLPPDPIAQNYQSPQNLTHTNNNLNLLKSLDSKKMHSISNKEEEICTENFSETSDLNNYEKQERDLTLQSDEGNDEFAQSPVSTIQREDDVLFEDQAYHVNNVDSEFEEEEEDEDDDDEENNVEEYDGDDDNNSKPISDISNKEVSHEKFAKRSSFHSEINQLSPESSYDIIENNAMEGNIFIEASKNEINDAAGITFSEKKHSNKYQIAPLSSSSDPQAVSDKLESFNPPSTKIIAEESTPISESKKSSESKEINEDQSFTFVKSQQEAAQKLQAKLVAQREAEENRCYEIMAKIKLEEQRHIELVARREAEEKRRNDVIAQRIAEEKRRNELKALWEAEEKRREELRAQKEAEEKQALVDSDDVCMQKFLASDLEPTTRLNDFVAHSDYVSSTSADSIPAQVETVYRDINSMIDTLGLNARSLKEFTIAHTENRKVEGRNREDLKEDSGWVLGEIETLSSIIENDLYQELEKERVRELGKKVEVCRDLQKHLIKLRSRHNDIKKIIATSQDLNHIAIARAQPLGIKQAEQQHDLRQKFMNFQKLLLEAEDSLAVLNAKIVAQSNINNRSNGSAGPTVEAVMRTIAKLTNMAEKRSGNVDVLEGLMRKLKLNSSAGNYYQDVNTTPVKQGLSHGDLTSSKNNSYFTPKHLITSLNQSSLLSSVGSFSQISPPRRKLSGYTSEEKTKLRSKLDRKKEVAFRLRHALESTGMRVRVIEDH